MGASAYSALVLGSSPKMYLKGQEASGLPQDASGNGNNMTSTAGGTPLYQQPGPMSDFGITLPFANFERASISTAVDNLTFEVWLRVIGYVTNGSLCGNNNVGSDGEEVLTDVGGGFQVVVQSVGFQSPSAFAFTASWVYVVVTRDATVWKYYVNGAVDTANAGTSTPISPTGTTHLGRSLGNNFVWAHFAYYETALSGAQVAAHYAASQAPDVTSLVSDTPVPILGRGASW